MLATPREGREGGGLGLSGPGAVIARRNVLSAAVPLVCVAPRTVPVAASLVAVWIPVAGMRVFLNDFRTNVIQNFAPDLLISLELFALAAST